MPTSYYLSDLSSYHSAGLFAADMLASLLIFKHTSHTSTSGPLHMIFLSRRLFHQVSAYSLTPSGLYSYVISVNPSLVTLSQILAPVVDKITFSFKEVYILILEPITTLPFIAKGSLQMLQMWLNKEFEMRRWPGWTKSHHKGTFRGRQSSQGQRRRYDKDAEVKVLQGQEPRSIIAFTSCARQGNGFSPGSARRKAAEKTHFRLQTPKLCDNKCGLF